MSRDFPSSISADILAVPGSVLLAYEDHLASLNESSDRMARVTNQQVPGCLWRVLLVVPRIVSK